MANLGSGNITVTILNRRTKDSGRHNTNAKLAFGDGALLYPSGGIPLSLGAVGCPNTIESLVVYDMGAGGYSWSWDGANNKLIALQAPVPGAGATPANPRMSTTLASFSVLAASALTNTGSSVIGGAAGISPNGAGSVTGFPPGVVTGATHYADATSATAQTDLATAIAALQALTPGTVFAPATVLGTGGTIPTLGPGVYNWATAGQITGALTLNAGGDPTQQFIFQVGSALTTATAASIVLAGGALADNVFWVIGSSATLGTGTQMLGNILAHTSITFVTGASLTGRALANIGAVTLDSDSISASAQVAGAGAATPLVQPVGVAIAAQTVRCEILGW